MIRRTHRLLRRSPGLREAAGVSVEYVAILVLVCVLGVSAWKRYREAVQEDVQETHSEFGYMR